MDYCCKEEKKKDLEWGLERRGEHKQKGFFFFLILFCLVLGCLVQIYEVSGAFSLALHLDLLSTKTLHFQHFSDSKLVYSWIKVIKECQVLIQKYFLANLQSVKIILLFFFPIFFSQFSFIVISVFINSDRSNLLLELKALSNMLFGLSC